MQRALPAAVCITAGEWLFIAFGCQRLLPKISSSCDHQRQPRRAVQKTAWQHKDINRTRANDYQHNAAGQETFSKESIVIFEAAA